MKDFFALLFAIVLLSSCDRPAKDSKSVSFPRADRIDTLPSIIIGAPSIDTTGLAKEIIKYPSGQIQIIGFSRSGLREGLWVSYYENGSKWSELYYSNGKRNGKTTAWYENGVKRFDGFYKDDKKFGVWSYWDEKGNLVTTETLK